MARRRPTPTLVDIQCDTPRGFHEFKRIAAGGDAAMFGRDDPANRAWRLPDVPSRMPARFHQLLQATGCVAVPVEPLRENPGSALPWVVGGLALAGAAWWFMRSSSASAAPAPPPCPITDATLASYVKTKATTYKLYVPPDKTQPVANWPAPKATYLADKNAHTFSTVDCGFYKWSGTKWVPDDAENAAMAKFVGASTTPALSGHPADSFMF